MSLLEQFGPYVLHELINTGGMADLYLATDENKQPVAIRRLHKKGAFDFTSKRRFVRGCEVLSQIHQNEFVIGISATERSAVLIISRWNILRGTILNFSPPIRIRS